MMRFVQLLGLSVISSAMVGCASLNIDVIAPPVAASPTLQRGRELYVTKCTACHAPEPIRKYSAAKWEEIIPDMAEDTKLSAADTNAVAEYVRWVLKQPALAAR